MSDELMKCTRCEKESDSLFGTTIEYGLHCGFCLLQLLRESKKALTAQHKVDMEFADYYVNKCLTPRSYTSTEEPTFRNTEEIFQHWIQNVRGK